MRVPEQQRHAPRLRERRGEDEVDRAHVGEHGVDAAGEHERRERAHEPQPTPQTAAGAEEADRDVRRKVVRAHACREHDELVAALRERLQLRHRRGENGIVRVDDLRDHEQPHV